MEAIQVQYIEENNDDIQFTKLELATIVSKIDDSSSMVNVSKAQQK